MIQNNIDSSHYRDCWFNFNQHYRDQFGIRADFHNLSTYKQNKLALNPFDDKRYLIKDSTDTLPWGHRDIPIDEL